MTRLSELCFLGCSKCKSLRGYFYLKEGGIVTFSALKPVSETYALYAGLPRIQLIELSRECLFWLPPILGKTPVGAQLTCRSLLAAQGHTVVTVPMPAQLIHCRSAPLRLRVRLI